MSAKLINLLEHPVTILMGSRAVEVPPSGTVARARVEPRKFGYVRVDGTDVPLKRMVVIDVEDLPDPRPRTWLIVSSIVAQAARDRQDLLVPFRTKRRNGRVIGCEALIQI